MFKGRLCKDRKEPAAQDLRLSSLPDAIGRRPSRSGPIPMEGTGLTDFMGPMTRLPGCRRENPGLIIEKKDDDEKVVFFKDNINDQYILLGWPSIPIINGDVVPLPGSLALATLRFLCFASSWHWWGDAESCHDAKHGKWSWISGWPIEIWENICVTYTV